MNLILQWALKYQAAGFSIIPLKPKSKEPAIEWKEFQTRLPTLQEIQEWFQSDMNLGVVTGSISNLCVLDADGEIGLQFLKEQNLVSNVAVLTGKGKHLWYRWTEGIRNSQSKIAEGIDIRGEGGFVVAPPSIHPSGSRYHFIGVPQLEILPPLSLSLLNILDKEKKETSKSPDWISQALEEMKHGHVHDTLVSVLGKFRYHNFSITDTIKLLRPYAFNPDGTPFKELDTKVKEIWERYDSPKSFQIRTPQSIRDWDDFIASREVRTTKKVLQSNFKSLDAFLQGGLQTERPFIIAARTGENKTNTAIALAKNLCQEGKRVVYFSTEFSYHKIWERYIAQLSNSEEFREHSFYVCDSFSPSIEQVEQILNQIMPDLFIFDYIQHIAEDKDGLTKFMQGLTFMQKKYNTQAVVLAQLNRYADFIENGKRIEPRLSMIKGSDSIGQMSSRVLLLSVTKVSPEMDEIEAILDKNDSGSKGKFFLGLYKNPYKIEELK